MKNKYRAWVAGSPNMSATLNCDKGRFNFSASKADTSQIDNTDGVDVTLVLASQSESKNVMLSSTGHHHHSRGHANVMYYHNDDPLNCAITGEGDETDMHEIKVRHKHSGKVYTYKRSKGGFGKNCMVHDTSSGHFISFDTSKTSSVTCGSGDENFEVVGIEHKNRLSSCTSMSEAEEDDDNEDNQHD